MVYVKTRIWAGDGESGMVWFGQEFFGLFWKLLEMVFLRL